MSKSDSSPFKNSTVSSEDNIYCVFVAYYIYFVSKQMVTILKLDDIKNLPSVSHTKA